MPQLVFANHGPALVSTNYWETPLADAGLFFLTWHRGVARLLVPQVHESALADTATGREVLMTTGVFHDRKDYLEIMWEDDSDAPFSLLLAPQQVHRQPSGADAAGATTTCDVYVVGFRGTPLLAGEWPARLRKGTSLPNLTPWVR